jgi:formate hydrogenlyase transcriptional activator
MTAPDPRQDLTDPRSLSSEAIRLLHEGRATEALSAIERALELAREGPTARQVMAQLLRNLAYIRLQVGQYEAAARTARDLRAAAGALSDIDGQLVSYSLEGDAHSRSGSLDAATTAYQAGLSLAETGGTGRNRARLLGQVGRTYLLQGRYPEALDRFLQSLEINRRGAPAEDVCVDLINLACACRECGAVTEASSYAHEALTLARELGISHILADALCAVSECSLDLGDREAALEHARAALLAGGRPADAMEALDACTTLAAQQGITRTGRIAGIARSRALLQMGRAQDALEAVMRARSRQGQPLEGTAAIEMESLLGDIREALGDLPAALASVREAARLESKRLNELTTGQSARLHALLAGAQADRQLARALEHLPDALVLVRRDGRVALANDEASRTFGADRRKLETARVGDLLTQSGSAVDPWALLDAPGDGKVPRRPGHRLTGHRQDGSQFPAEVSLTELVTDAAPVALCCIRDISATISAEEALRAQTQGQLRLRRQVEAENLVLREELRGSPEDHEIIGQSAAMRAVLAEVAQVAKTDASVLILGETGTGKELVARAIHAQSARGSRPMVTTNCAALPESLIESELFGHERGAFTGAVGRHRGRFELANEGTLFLDEIGELPLAMQSKLLRVLQDGTFQRLGGTATIKVDVRIIAATNRHIEERSKNGTFRSDLFYRLSVFPIEIPPLRERREDIVEIAAWLAERHGRRIGKRIQEIDAETLRMLKAYDWPGNVRELQNVIERAVILSHGGVLRLDRVLGGQPAAETSGMRLEDVERDHLVRVLRRCNWKVKGKDSAAEALGLNPSTLRSRMKKLGVARPSS